MKAILIIAAIIAIGVGGYFLVNPDNDKWSLFYYDNCDTCTSDGEIVLDAYDSSETCLKAGKKSSEIDLDGRAYREEDNRPQPKTDRDTDKGMAITVGRLREDNVFDFKFAALSHNTIRGAAGGGILTAELAFKKGYLAEEIE